MRTIRKSVLYQYIISYASVVLLACLLMGIFLFSISVHEIEKTNFRNTQNKVDLAAADFELQYDIMRDNSIEISLKLVYKPGYFSKNKYYVYELLQDFKNIMLILLCSMTISFFIQVQNLYLPAAVPQIKYQHTFSLP